MKPQTQEILNKKVELLNEVNLLSDDKIDELKKLY